MIQLELIRRLLNISTCRTNTCCLALARIDGPLIALGLAHYFKAEVEKLVRIFRRLCATELDAGQFSSMAEELIEIADFLADAKLKLGGQMPNIYRIITKVPLDNLFYEDDTQRREVTRIRQLAQGRAGR